MYHDKWNFSSLTLLFAITLHDKTSLSSFLVHVACDGAAVMFGRESGVAKLLKS
jgi:hypothetical protein